MRHDLVLALLALLLLGCPGEETEPPADDDTGSADDDDVSGDDDTTSGNHPPTTPTVTIDPAYPSVCDTLWCRHQATPVDPDGDPVDYRFDWTMDGVAFASPDEDRVDPEHLVEGQVWTCTVTPNDGLVDGSPGHASVEIGGAGLLGGRAVAHIETSGGTEGGLADVTLNWELFDCLGTSICHASYLFEADYRYGTAQADDFPDFVDEIVTWTHGNFVGDDCPPGWYTPVPDPVETWRWSLHPMAFVSCDRIAADPDLSARYLGMDDSGHIPTDDGTFGDYCVTAGPITQADLGTGPIEAVQLTPCIEGELDSLGDFAYFPSPDPTHAPTWTVGGVLMQSTANPTEPVEGLEGPYEAHRFWYGYVH